MADSSLEKLQSLMTALDDAKKLKLNVTERLIAIAHVIYAFQEVSRTLLGGVLSGHVETVDKLWCALESPVNAALGQVIGHLTHDARAEMSAKLEKQREWLGILDQSSETPEQREEIYDQSRTAGLLGSYTRDQYLASSDFVRGDRQAVDFQLGRLEQEALELDQLFHTFVTHESSP
ncbi:MAG: hypothetical protein Greene041662_979 [Candidatus Peregrinibacteria bacterium Greene0416_62]|nr:MAG: hypothetical protein Greene041662_979 [Candidatus Peregrinibacteria bacterium Greene0416_62]TSC97893.1 MAG: hypothetical protein Greene101449_1062 [Candidatus Peregrinibacteria bacterium Greene1014_49]